MPGSIPRFGGNDSKKINGSRQKSEMLDVRYSSERRGEALKID
jgi:hypothetical protein